MVVAWESAQHTSFTLWDIDREFQNAYEAYEQWQARNRRRRNGWACLGKKTRDDALGKALSLGRQVQRLMETGMQMFGTRFEQGDSQCNTVLSAQLLRLQYEIRQPLYDTALCHTLLPLPVDALLTTARSIRRACLTALRDQYARFQYPRLTPVLPPPRFKVDYCPFATQLRKDLRSTKSSTLRATKLHPTNRHDDREICPHCDACISVAAHSGLPDYRCILFTSHLPLDPKTCSAEGNAIFACSSCYKTFDDSYAFLDHVFQKQIGSERSCLRRTVSGRWALNEEFVATDPGVVEQCLRNCLIRELGRVRTMKGLESKIGVEKIGVGGGVEIKKAIVVQEREVYSGGSGR